MKKINALPELTVKALILSILLAALLTAANAYLALRIGTTISASIPAAVIAMGVLRLFRKSNILESNMVQTAASAGEGVAAVISFVLPAALILHVWQGFPYLETFSLTVLGGLLGVLFTIPLRRILLNLPTLTFPEGTAVGKVLQASTNGGKRLKPLVQGIIVGGGISLFQSGFKIFSDLISMWIVTGRAISGTAVGFEPALFAAGYIVGIRAAVSLLVGVILGWVVLLPLISMHYGLPVEAAHYDMALDLWHDHLRFIGVGIMLVGGVWTLLTLIKPVAKGLAQSFTIFKKNQALNQAEIPNTDRDMPFGWMIAGVAVVSVLTYVLIVYILWHLNLPISPTELGLCALATLIFVLVLGWLFAIISGYFVGLLGSTNAPLSGLLIMGVLLLGFLYMLSMKNIVATAALQITTLMVFAITLVAAISALSLENIQDLKAGQIIGATPWKQQIVLAVGVIAAAAVIGPILNLLFHAYGMGGVFPHSGMDPAQMLAAPQAGMIATIAQGVLHKHLESNMLLIGCALAVVIVIIDELLKSKNIRVPALAVGLGVYLPPDVITPIFLGALVSYLVSYRMNKSSHSEEAKHGAMQNGTLLACGIVAGSALMGVILAIPFAIIGNTDALSLVSVHFTPWATGLALIVTIALCYWMYHTGLKVKSASR